jgi:hypothetical protein
MDGLPLTQELIETGESRQELGFDPNNFTIGMPPRVTPLEI